MTGNPLTLCSTVGEAERSVVIAAAQQLSDAVSRVLGSTWPVSLTLADPDGGKGAGSISIASLIGDVYRNEPIEATTQRWLERIARWSEDGQPRILLCTLFRNISSPSQDRATMERLRRLNMMAVHLSRATGIEIVDLDRLFSLYGARNLGTDYRCIGPNAAELGGHAIASAIFAGGLDDHLAPSIQEEAARQHYVRDMAHLLQRRIAVS